MHLWIWLCRAEPIPQDLNIYPWTSIKLRLHPHLLTYIPPPPPRFCHFSFPLFFCAFWFVSAVVLLLQTSLKAEAEEDTYWDKHKELKDTEPMGFQWRNKCINNNDKIQSLLFNSSFTFFFFIPHFNILIFTLACSVYTSLHCIGWLSEDDWVIIGRWLLTLTCNYPQRSCIHRRPPIISYYSSRLQYFA